MIMRLGGIGVVKYRLNRVEKGLIDLNQSISNVACCLFSNELPACRQLGDRQRRLHFQIDMGASLQPVVFFQQVDAALDESFAKRWIEKNKIVMRVAGATLQKLYGRQSGNHACIALQGAQMFF